MSRGWQSSVAIHALDAAGFFGSDEMAERMVEMLQRDGHHRAGPALDAEVKAIARDLPEMFGEESDDSEVGDEFGHLHPEGDDLRQAELWRALNRGGFSGSRAGMRRMVRLIGPGVTGPMVAYAVADLAAEAPEAFWGDDLEVDDEDEPDEVDPQAIYEGHLARFGPTYEGPPRDGSPALVGVNGGTARTTAALLAQAGVRPASRGRAPRPGPRDATEATSDRLLRSARY